MSTQMIPRSMLRPNPKNPNVMPEELLAKLEKNIKRTGKYPPLIVRPLWPKKRKPDDQPEAYMFVDGFHRDLVLGRLGYQEVECTVWDITEREADLALATLNRLHGEEDLRKRADLIQDLLAFTPKDQLSGLIPEDGNQIEDLLKLTQVDLDFLTSMQREQAERMEEETPKPWTIILFPAQRAVIEAAIAQFKAQEGTEDKKYADGQALELICADWRSGANAEPDSTYSGDSPAN